jgi:23S rRNA A2030 N6-methylase RlmJ
MLFEPCTLVVLPVITMDMGYEPGNISDRYKHGNLEALVRALAHDRMTFIEWHSGAGRYEIEQNGQKTWYDGSAIRVMETMLQEHIEFEAFLTEIDADRRAELTKHTASYRNVTINDDWRKHLRQYVGLADEHTLTVIDPAGCHEFYENHMLSYIVPLIYSGSHCFIFVPEIIRLTSHRQIVRTLTEVTRNAGRHGLDLHHPVVDDVLDRIDHNIVISDPAALAACEQHHLAMLHKDPNYAQYPTDG